MKTFHVLNGDCLADQLAQTDINRDFIICRECLIDGEVESDSLAEFWAIRAAFIEENFNIPAEEYFIKTVREFEKLERIPDHSSVCLWFENDLFCQANMWFVLSVLASRPNLKIYRVFPFIPDGTDRWKGFGTANSDSLQLALDNKILFTPHDLELGKNLWTAYQKGDLDKLRELSGSPSACFEYLEEVCQAHIERFPSDLSPGRPERVLKEILDTGSKDFPSVFKTFSEIEGIYGFGDLQIQKRFDRLIQSYI